MRINASLLLSLMLIASANSAAFCYYNREYANRLNHESSERYDKMYEEESRATQQNLTMRVELERYYQQQLQSHESDDTFFWGRRQQTSDLTNSAPSSSNTFQPVAFTPTPANSMMPDSAHIVPMQTSGTLLGGIAETRFLPRKKTEAKLSDLFFHLEDQLIRLHDTNRIGSLDIDKFSEALLAIKRNYNVMSKQSGQISTRQESILKSELKHLGDEIACRGRQM